MRLAEQFRDLRNWMASDLFPVKRRLEAKIEGVPFARLVFEQGKRYGQLAWGLQVSTQTAAGVKPELRDIERAEPHLMRAAVSAVAPLVEQLKAINWADDPAGGEALGEACAEMDQLGADLGFAARCEEGSAAT